MIRQGEVYWVDLGEPSGSGPGYRHPHVVAKKRPVQPKPDPYNRCVCSDVESGAGVVARECSVKQWRGESSQGQRGQCVAAIHGGQGRSGREDRHPGRTSVAGRIGRAVSPAGTSRRRVKHDLGLVGDEALLGVVTLEVLGLVLNSRHAMTLGFFV